MKTFVKKNLYKFFVSSHWQRCKRLIFRTGLDQFSAMRNIAFSYPTPEYVNDNIILCEPYRFMYYPVFKAGNTTIRGLIMEAEHGVYIEDCVFHMDTNPHNLFTILTLQESLSIDYDDYFRFTFVRNPWDRLVSCYSNKIVGRKDSSVLWNYNYANLDQMSFEKFVRFVYGLPDQYADGHIKSQTDMFDPSKMDFIGRFENFSEDLACVIDRCGLKVDKDRICATKRMKSDHKPYTEYYTEKTKQLIEQRYQADVLAFNYRFGG